MNASLRRLSGLVLLAGSLAGLALAEPQTGNKLEVKSITYGDLGKFIRAQTGKVVVDFWATWCVPCRKEFPHLVELHRKYGKDGLVAISVDLEDPKNGKLREKAEKFLAEMGGAFPHFMLDARQEEWVERLKIEGPPCIFVFNKENRFVKKLPVLDGKGETVEAVDFAAIEKLVVDLLKR